MDVEKLIEQLRYLADTPSYTAFHDAKEREIICDQCEADFCYDKQQDAHWCMYEALSRAATALSTLQAENENLRAELEQKERYYEQMIDALAATESAELEQVKRERDAALEYLHGICFVCKNYSSYHNRGKCQSCAYEPARNKGAEVNDNWKWRGIKEN